MIGELLGEWMRLTGHGSISQYRQKAIWLSGTVDVRLDQGEPSRWLRDLSDRGYLELDWKQGRWDASPLVVTKLPTGACQFSATPCSIEPAKNTVALSVC